TPLRYYQLIPLTSLLDSNSPDFHSTSVALLSAFRTHGFLYLTHYTALVPSSTIDKVFHHSAALFARPQHQKDSITSRSATSNCGYMRPGREKLSSALTAEDTKKDRDKGADMKETYDIGREGRKGNPQPWPDKLDEEGVMFRETMQDFFLRCKELHVVVMRGIAVGLGLDVTFFDGMLDVGDNNLRLLHYPSVDREAFRGGKVRAGAHSDYGSVTFLFQDQRGGLQIEGGDGSGGWMDVEPREGTIVVNAGDALARWSNDLIRSTKHRVVEPPIKPHISSPGLNGAANDLGKHPARYSVAYFCQPNYDVWIDALPGTWEHVPGGKKYEGINSMDYLFSRLNATVSDY
ncbi:MAG: hypothetical protein Q9174_003908, partial [Haloplaca sp. 1 TL-2023]